MVELAATDADSAAVRLHMENTSSFLEKADACRAWLRNGVTALTVYQINYVLEALVMPAWPADPLETYVDRLHRANHIRGLRAQLVAARNGRS